HCVASWRSVDLQGSASTACSSACKEVYMKRNLLIIVLGFGFLIFMAWLGGILTMIEPHQPSAAVQTAQAGPYQLTLQVTPNPPLLTQPATLPLPIVRPSSQHIVSHAHVLIECS